MVGVFPRALRGAVAFMTHAVLAVVIIACVLVVEKVLSVTAVGDHLIVDVVPMRYLFDLIDVAVIGVFGFYGVRDLIRELNE
jgi:hypothetical protein